ncbi:streptamidine family RiPP [Cryobacterium sp. PH29-G1]|nr:streptamidine family RiPP [Cryobacterium sp. PH29-G1]MDJ0350249.1 streptamidine family RiPP [Cryobacterium sp. PH29-G1]
METENPVATTTIITDIVGTETLAHLSATHSNALVENPFD